jgi:hypothetical protein
MARQYTNWKNTRGNSNNKLNDVLPITNLANGTRYFSAVDGEIYFGDIFINEVTSIAWNVQQQTMPIFGYNSYTFDDVAVGSRLIQGQFAINFTERDFLNKIQNSETFRKISRRMYAEDIGATTLYSDYRKRLHLPLWDKGFDIVIGLGKVNGTLSGLDYSSPYSTYLILNCVQVTGSTIQLDYNGEPVQEVYTFIARDIKTSYSDESESNGYIENNVSNISTTSQLHLIANLDLTADIQHIYISTVDNVTFKSGTLQFKKDFNNKMLNKEIKLNVLSDKIFCYTLDNDYLLAFKKENKNNTLLKADLKCEYVQDNNTYSKNILVDFNIKC